MSRQRKLRFRARSSLVLALASGSKGIVHAIYCNSSAVSNWGEPSEPRSGKPGRQPSLYAQLHSRRLRLYECVMWKNNAGMFGEEDMRGYRRSDSPLEMHITHRKPQLFHLPLCS